MPRREQRESAPCRSTCSVAKQVASRRIERILRLMGTPFAVEARCERASISPGKTTLWAGIKVDPRGKGLESERAPLAVVLVIDTSGSMNGPPLQHVLAS